MGSRKRHVLLLLLAGGALVAVPALASSAGSSTATVVGTEARMWSPMTVAITPGGTVTFEVPSTTVPHGVVWKSVPETPSCSGVPIDEGRTSWKGTCTFATEGVYEYYCYVHGVSMSGAIDVNAAGTTTTTTISSTTTTSSSTSFTTTTSTSATSTSSSTQTSTTVPTTTANTEQTQSTAMPATISATTTSSTKASEEEAGGDSLRRGSVRLAAQQRGDDVRGSVEVAQAGSRLEVELLVPRAAIALGGRGQQTMLLVGRLTKARLPAGRERFEVALKGSARRALERRGRLVLRVRIALRSPHGARSTRTLIVTLRR